MMMGIDSIHVGKVTAEGWMIVCDFLSILLAAVRIVTEENLMELKCRSARISVIVSTKADLEVGMRRLG